MDQYFYKVNSCPAEKASDFNCICWHNKGSGPFPEAVRNGPTASKMWRTIPHSAEIELLIKIKEDLLMRAEEDSNGVKVVDLSHSLWVQLKEVTV